MKRIAALTMLRSDEFFLKRWVDYYGRQLGRENLYIFFDGTDQTVPGFCEGTHTAVVPRLGGQVLKADRKRINYLNERAEKLFGEGYDMVIGTDVDEFLVPDPSLGLSLPEYLERHCDRVSISGLGIDVGQNTSIESVLDESAPFLGQRQYALLSTRYSKSSVITRPVRWGSGFHRTRFHGYRIREGLFLFHFGSVDLARMEAKFSDTERIAEGWTRHFRKRIRTISIISEGKALDWEKATRAARVIQNILHPVRSLNKPAMLSLKLVVRIPERFHSLV